MRGQTMVGAAARFFTVSALVAMVGAGCDYASTLPTNYPCRVGGDCISGICHHGVCLSPQPRDNGEACADNGDCRSFRCLNGACAAGIRPGGQGCLSNQECASGGCVAGLCTRGRVADGGADTAPTARCGDGKKNGKEPCDGKDLGGKTCQTQGLTGGALTCLNCKLDTKGCYRVYAPKGVLVSKAAKSRGDPALAYGGGGYLVAWTDERMGSRDIFASRVDRGGKVLNVAGIPVTTDTSHQDQPAVAAGGSNYLVAWTDRMGGNNTVQGARISQGGAVLDSAAITIASAKKGQHQPAVAFYKNDYFVAWTDDRNEANGDIFGARVNSGGTLLDPNGLALSTEKGGQRNPTLVHGGVFFMAMWDDARSGPLDIYASRVDFMGNVQDPSGQAITSHAKDQQAPVIAYNGTAYLVAWTDKRGANLDIYAARVSLSGQVLDASGFAVSKATGDQLSPAVAAANDGTYLLVWADYRGGADAAIYGARVGADGKVVDTQGARISNTAGTQTAPVVATDGSGRFLVVWRAEVKGANPIISCTRFVP